MDVTIGEIDRKLNLTIFQNSAPKQYIEREKLLKKYIDLTFRMSIDLVEKPHKEFDRISYYLDKRIKRSLRRLSDYVGYLTKELEEKKIIEFCEKQNLFYSNYDIDLPFLMANSYYGSIKYDLYWIKDLLLYEALEISSGTFDINKLADKLPSTFNHFQKEILKYFKNDSIFSEFYGTLKEIEITYKNKAFRASNLLIIIAVEGIVRKLGEYLIEKLDLKNIKESNSLDGFLRNINWESDFSISQTEYQLITGDFSYDRERKPLENLKINLKERLDFLRRRFKNDRDLILHGIESDYGKGWNLFVNLSALNSVYETTMYYRNLYK